MIDSFLDPLVVVRNALALTPPNYLSDLRNRQEADGLAQAVREHDTAAVFNWIVPLLALHGVSDRAAFTYARGRPAIRWDDLIQELAASPTCPRLHAWWTFSDCRYRKSKRTCAEPGHLSGCFLPPLDLRKGGLNIAVVGLALFVRDVCGGDLVGWIDDRLAGADLGPRDPRRGQVMRNAVLLPLCAVPGTGPKLWSMILAELLLGADPHRERWTTTGVSFVVVDSLIHNLLHRTGLIQTYGRPHPYGPSCWAPDGCADAVERIAALIDARAYGVDYPAIFPRLVTRALWWFSAEEGLNQCDGRQIDDSIGCRQRFCPARRQCACLPLR